MVQLHQLLGKSREVLRVLGRGCQQTSEPGSWSRNSCICHMVFPPVDAQAVFQAKARVILFDDDTEDGMTVWDERRGKCYVYINRLRLNGRRANFT